MMGITPRISFRPVKDADLAMLNGWLRRPHLREWWGEPETECALIAEMVAGRDTTRPYIIEADDNPIGYIQVWFIADHQNAEWIAQCPWLGELPASAVGVDLSIADPKLLSRGLGSRALCTFSQTLHDTGHGPIIIDPDPANKRAIRAYEKAGYRPIPHLVGKTDCYLIMQFDPKATEHPS